MPFPTFLKYIILRMFGQLKISNSLKVEFFIYIIWRCDFSPPIKHGVVFALGTHE